MYSFLLNITANTNSASANSVDDTWSAEMLKIMFTLSLLLIIIVALAWFLKKMIRNRVRQVNEGHLIKILAQRTVSPKAVVHVIEVLGKAITFAETSQGIELLSELDLTEEQRNFIEKSSENKPKTNFGQIFKKVSENNS